MCDDTSPPCIDPDDPFVAALSRALTRTGPEGELVDIAKGFPALHDENEIVGTEAFDSVNDLHTSGVRFAGSTERDLVYRFERDEEDEEVALRLSPGVLMARLPASWSVDHAFIQTVEGRTPVNVENDNYVLFFGPLDSPLRLVVICEGTSRCTPWTIA